MIKLSNSHIEKEAKKTIENKAGIRTADGKEVSISEMLQLDKEKVWEAIIENKNIETKEDLRYLMEYAPADIQAEVCKRIKEIEKEKETTTASINKKATIENLPMGLFDEIKETIYNSREFNSFIQVFEDAIKKLDYNMEFNWKSADFIDEQSVANGIIKLNLVFEIAVYNYQGKKVDLDNPYFTVSFTGTFRGDKINDGYEIKILDSNELASKVKDIKPIEPENIEEKPEAVASTINKKENKVMNNSEIIDLKYLIGKANRCLDQKQEKEAKGYVDEAVNLYDKLASSGIKIAIEYRVLEQEIIDLWNRCQGFWPEIRTRLDDKYTDKQDQKQIDVFLSMGSVEKKIAKRGVCKQCKEEKELFYDEICWECAMKPIIEYTPAEEFKSQEWKQFLSNNDKEESVKTSALKKELPYMKRMAVLEDYYKSKGDTVTAGRYAQKRLEKYAKVMKVAMDKAQLIEYWSAEDMKYSDEAEKISQDIVNILKNNSMADAYKIFKDIARDEDHLYWGLVLKHLKAGLKEGNQ